MTCKEIVKRAVTFEAPPKTPLFFLNRDLEQSYIAIVDFKADPSFVPDVPGRSEWGYIMVSLDGTMGQPESCPLEDSWDLLDGYNAPNPDIDARYSHIPDFIAEHSDKYIIANLGITGFDKATFIRGFENFLEDIYCEEENSARLLDIVFGFERSVILHLCSYEIDAIAFFDDWGTQNALMINPDKWRQVFKARYKEQFDLIHSMGKHVFFHSCGQIQDIIPDLIEIGADILNLNQPNLFGIEKMRDLYGGKVCFCCPVDHQSVAIHGSREEIFDYVRRLASCLGGFNGGYIGYIEDYRICGMSEETYQNIKEAFTLLNR